MSNKKLKPIEVGGVYAIVWRDHFDLKEGSGSAWLTYDDKDAKRDMLCQTYGRVIAIEPHFYVVASTDGDIHHPEEKVYSNVFKVVKDATVKWERLK